MPDPFGLSGIWSRGRVSGGCLHASPPLCAQSTTFATLTLGVRRSDLRLLVSPMGGVPLGPSHKVCEGVSGCELSTARFLGNQCLLAEFGGDTLLPHRTLTVC